MLNPFIPENLALAPSSSEAEFPNLLLREIMVDSNCSFQVWSPKSDAILKTYETELLKCDILRIEAICTRLVSLFGAACSEYEDHLLTNQKLIYHWEDVLLFTSKYGFKPDCIDVLFTTQTIRLINTSSINFYKQWVAEPACWDISFLELKPVSNGFQIVPRHPYLSVIVWTGDPIIKFIP